VELQASRARLVEATDSERRRIERDLHDGTQQRLVSIAMSLGLVEAKLPASAAQAKPIVTETREALAAALAELRDLTHGIHPAILTERGLPAALDELCHRSPVTAHLRLLLDGRLPAPVETAAYYVVSEALTNAAKHSRGGQVRVAATCRDGRLTVEVADDGVGGAGTGPDGSGLRRRDADPLAPLGQLSTRERDVLALMAEGRSNKAIAERLFVSEYTVQKHVGNIFDTLRLPPSPDDHRRVLAVVAYLNAQ